MHRAAYLVCDAFLELEGPNLAVHATLPGVGSHVLSAFVLPGMTRPTARALRREAIVLLAGPTADGFGGGDFRRSPAELAGVACLAARLGQEIGEGPVAAMREIAGAAASVLGAHWSEVVRISLDLRGIGEPAESRLSRAQRVISLDQLPEPTAQAEELARYLCEACKDVVALSQAIADASGARPPAEAGSRGQ